MRTFKADRRKFAPPTNWKYVGMSKDDFPRDMPFAYMAYDPSLLRALLNELTEEVKSKSLKFLKFPWNFTVHGDLKDVPSLTEVEFNQWTALWYMGDNGIIKCRRPKGWPDNFGGPEKTRHSGESAASQLQRSQPSSSRDTTPKTVTASSSQAKEGYGRSETGHFKDKQPTSSRDAMPKTVAAPVHVSSECENVSITTAQAQRPKTDGTKVSDALEPDGIVPEDNNQLRFGDQNPEVSQYS